MGARPKDVGPRDLIACGEATWDATATGLRNVLDKARRGCQSSTTTFKLSSFPRLADVVVEDGAERSCDIITAPFS